MTSGLDEGVFELIRQVCIRHIKKKGTTVLHDAGGNWWKRFVVAGKENEYDVETVLCGREHQNQMCFFLCASFTVCFSQDTKLFVDDKAPWRWTDAHMQSSTVKREENKLKICYRSGVRLSVCSVCTSLESFFSLPSSSPAWWLKSAVQKSPEGTDYQQAGAGSFPASA